MITGRDLTSILAALGAGGVEFILVGGLAAVTQGAPITTHDVDIVHARAPENVDRLIKVLTFLNARYRGRPPESPLPPNRAALCGPGHSLFMTDVGPIDCLGAIEMGKTFDDLLPLSVEITIDGRSLHVLGLETIVALKRASPHPKDKLALPILEATLRRIKA